MIDFSSINSIHIPKAIFITIFMIAIGIVIFIKRRYDEKKIMKEK